jgi:hypothetical protein
MFMEVLITCRVIGNVRPYGPTGWSRNLHNLHYLTRFSVPLIPNTLRSDQSVAGPVRSDYGEITVQSDKVAKIIKVIEEIAFQTISWLSTLLWKRHAPAKQVWVLRWWPTKCVTWRSAAPRQAKDTAGVANAGSAADGARYRKRYGARCRRGRRRLSC